MRISRLLSLATITLISLQAGTASGQGTTANNAATATMKQGNFVPWEVIWEKDITQKKRVWRDVQRIDNPGIFASENDGKSLAAVLLDGIKNGNIKAYSPQTDRFMAAPAFSYDVLLADLQGKILVNNATDPETGREMASCLGSGDLSLAVHKFLIKEDWLTVKDKSAQIVRILGIAPVVNVVDENGATIEKTLFWIYYPDSREYLSQITAPESTLSWNDIFEQRQFESVVTKVKITDGLFNSISK